MLCVVAVPANAAPSTGGSLADAQAQASAARTKLAEMRTGLASGLSAYNTAARDLARTRAEIASNTKRLDEVKASLQAGQQSLDSQASFLYRTNGTGFVDVLLGSASFEEFASRLSVLQQIASKDAGLVVALKADKAEAQRLSSLLARREASQKALLGKVATRRDAVQGSIDRQQAYLGSLSATVQDLVDAQEKAAAVAERASSSDANAAPAPSQSGVAPAKVSPSKTSPSKPSPAPSRSAVALKLAKVEGRSGSYWVMAKESSSYSPIGVKFSGVTTEYGNADNGTGTSSGRQFNDRELTCAHRTLPFGTRLAVTHGNKHVIVIVTDRGPFTRGRMLDLTTRAASILGIDGVGQVSCEVVDPN